MTQALHSQVELTIDLSLEHTNTHSVSSLSMSATGPVHKANALSHSNLKLLMTSMTSLTIQTSVASVPDKQNTFFSMSWSE